VTTRAPGISRLLAGQPAATGPEALADHRARLGPLPRADGVIEALERSGVLGRGGAGFPVGRKWRSVAERAAGGAVVVANGAEGEPHSFKDRVLMTARPHLVLDGALLAAAAVGADELILYVGADHRSSIVALRLALAERSEPRLRRAQIVEAPAAYIAGESSAVVNYLSTGDARPTAIPPRPYERGLGNRPTLIQNVESLAMAALVARFGGDWYREAGRGKTRGTALVSVSGSISAPGVREIEYGTTLRELADQGGGMTAGVGAVLLGGYFGGWASVNHATWNRSLDPAALANENLSFGCGLVAFLSADDCGVRATANILRYMAGESARQCGPCIFGLGSIAETTKRLAAGGGQPGDLRNLARWSSQIVGRGACHHPDGAAGLLASALEVFAAEFHLHESSRRCSRPLTQALAS
jgi:NADH:ubiquinone oxidoreductase subunit F (NADH-binding)